MAEKIIWDFLMSKIGNTYGVAGLMGNLYVESHLNPVFLEGKYSKKFGMSSQEYTDAVDNGTYKDFVNDSAGYGLAQWTFWSRKEALLNYASSQKKSIGDLELQLNFLWDEIQKYKTVLQTLKSTTSIRQASDIVLERYEKAANLSESGRQTRCDYGMSYYQTFCEGKSTKKVVVTKDRTNIRSGNGKEFGRISQANNGQTFDWVTTVGDWHAVRLPKQVGWISAEFSKIN